MKKKVIKTNEMEQYLYPDNISSLDQFVEEIVEKSSCFVKMQYLNNDSETNPFFVSEDIKTVYVNFNNLTTLEEDEVMLMSDAEFEEQLAPFTYDICKGCGMDITASGMSEEEYDAHTRHQWFLNSDEMLKAGLIDRVYGITEE